MFKLLKYEFRSKQTRILSLLSVIIVINLVTLLIFDWSGVVNSNNRISFSGDTDINLGSGIFMILAIIVNCTSLIIAFISGIRVLFKDFSTESGSLLFSLPQKGGVIVGAKLISAALEYLIYFVSIVLFMVFHIVKITLAANETVVKELYIVDDLITIIISSLIGYLFVMILIYFSIAFTKFILKLNKHIAIGSFAIFIMISAIINRFVSILQGVFPYYYEIQGRIMTSIKTESITQLNLVEIVVEILLSILIYLLTAYIVEKKLEI